MKLLLNVVLMKNGYKNLVLLMSGLDGANGIILVMKANISLKYGMKQHKTLLQIVLKDQIIVLTMKYG